MADQVSDDLKTKRSQILIELGTKHQKEYADHFLNQEVEVLFEEQVEENGISYWQGHTRHYVRALVQSEENLTNIRKMCKVKKVSENGTLFCE